MKNIICCTFALFFALAFIGCTQDITEPGEPAIETTSLSKSVRAEFVRLPYYARMGIMLADYAVVYFYVNDPGVVPEDFNLLRVFNPAGTATLNPEDWAVDGFNIRSNPDDAIPRKVHLYGKGAVPFWFIPADAMNDATADGELTILEMGTLSSVRGTAEHFVEELHPSGIPDGGHEHPSLHLEAHGNLDNGGKFKVTIGVNSQHGEVRTTGKIVLDAGNH